MAQRLGFERTSRRNARVNARSRATPQGAASPGTRGHTFALSGAKMDTTSEDSGRLLRAPEDTARCGTGGIRVSMLEAVFDASPAGLVVLVGEDLVVDHVNAACRALTRPDIDPIGQRFEDIWPHGDPVVVPVLRNVLATGAGLSVEDYPLAAAGGIPPLLGPGEARAVAARPRGFPLGVGDLRRLGGAARGGAGRRRRAAARRRARRGARRDRRRSRPLWPQGRDRPHERDRHPDARLRRRRGPPRSSRSGSRRFACTRPTDGSCVWRTRPSRARSGARRSAASTRAWSTRAGRSGSSRAPPPCAAPTTRSWARC